MQCHYHFLRGKIIFCALDKFMLQRGFAKLYFASPNFLE